MRKNERSEAKELGLVFYQTGIPCVRGHIADRYVSSARCKICSEEDLPIQRLKHKEKIKPLKDVWRTKMNTTEEQKNGEKIIQKNKSSHHLIGKTIILIA